MNSVEKILEVLSLSDILNSIIGGIILLVITTITVFVSKVGHFVLRFIKIRLLGKLCCLQVAFGAVFYLFRDAPFRALFYVAITILMVISTAHILRAFTRLGIIDAHDKTKDGIDFESSLKMARSSIDFLGIGADKLTSLDAFEETMKRCATEGNQVRFLLSPSGNPALERAAKRNGTDVGDYGRKVEDSLRRIARVKKNGDLDIVVKQYAAEHDKDLQQFRLMFIDNTYCLAGWTVWGAHIGKDNPQLILKRPTREAPQNSAYKAFHDYFETVWDSPDSKLVDLNAL